MTTLTAPPEGLTFVPAPKSFAYGRTGVAAMLDGERVGWLYWNDDPFWADEVEISKVFVQPHWRRKGIATALLHAARAVEPNVGHSEVLSDDGLAWALSLGETLPDVRFECEQDRHRHYYNERVRDAETSATNHEERHDA